MNVGKFHRGQLEVKAHCAGYWDGKSGGLKSHISSLLDVFITCLYDHRIFCDDEVLHKYQLSVAVIRQHKASANPPSVNGQFSIAFVQGVLSMLKLWFQAQILSPKIAS